MTASSRIEWINMLAEGTDGTAQEIVSYAQDRVGDERNLARPSTISCSSVVFVNAVKKSGD